MEGRKTVGAFWLKQKKDRNGNDITVLSGNVDYGVGVIKIVPNKYKQAGDNKPDFHAYSAVEGAQAYPPRRPNPSATHEEDVPF